MKIEEKLAALEEIMDIEPGTLTPKTLLQDLDEWDSVTAISLIAFVEENFGKVLKGSQIKEFMTLADVLAIME